MKNKRDATVDVARGLSVLFIPAIHSVLLYSTPSVQAGPIGTVLGFIAENFAAPVFLFLMGISIPLGRQRSTGHVIKRSLMLLIWGYLLNVLKFILPIYFGMIPMAFFTENGIPLGSAGLYQLFTMADVLQSAAIGYFVCALLSSLYRFWEWSTLLAVAVMIISPFCWDFHWLGHHLSPVSNLINGRPPNAYFPVFPWIAYALLGTAAGHYLKYYKKSSFYRTTMFIGLFCVLAGLCLAPFEPKAWENDFYNLGPAGTCFHIGMVLLWLFVCYLIVRAFKWNILFSFFSWSSKNVTKLYMAQWTIVFWMLPFFGYRRLGRSGSCAAILITTVLTFLTVFAITKMVGAQSLKRKPTSNLFSVN